MVTYAVGHSLVFNVEQLLAIQRVFTKSGHSFLDVLRLTSDKNMKIIFNLHTLQLDAYIFGQGDARQSVLLSERRMRSVGGRKTRALDCCRCFPVTVIDVQQADLQVQSIKLQLKIRVQLADTFLEKQHYLTASNLLHLGAVPFSIRELGSAQVTCKQSECRQMT